MAGAFALAADPVELVESPSMTPVREAAAEEASADDCIGFEKTDVDKGVEYKIKNSCERKLSCQMSWKVACENGDGAVVASRSERARFALDAEKDHTVQASASDCKAGWRIDNVAWSCQ